MQIGLTILFISVSVGYLIYQLYKRFFAKETKCDGCAMSKLPHQKN